MAESEVKVQIAKTKWNIASLLTKQIVGWPLAFGLAVGFAFGLWANGAEADRLLRENQVLRVEIRKLLTK